MYLEINPPYYHDKILINTDQITAVCMITDPRTFDIRLYFTSAVYGEERKFLVLSFKNATDREVVYDKIRSFLNAVTFE